MRPDATSIALHLPLLRVDSAVRRVLSDGGVVEGTSTHRTLHERRAAAGSAALGTTLVSGTTLQQWAAAGRLSQWTSSSSSSHSAFSLAIVKLKVACESVPAWAVIVVSLLSYLLHEQEIFSTGVTVGIVAWYIIAAVCTVVGIVVASALILTHIQKLCSTETTDTIKTDAPVLLRCSPRNRTDRSPSAMGRNQHEQSAFVPVFQRIPLACGRTMLDCDHGHILGKGARSGTGGANLRDQGKLVCLMKSSSNQINNQAVAKQLLTTRNKNPSVNNLIKERKSGFKTWLAAFGTDTWPDSASQTCYCCNKCWARYVSQSIPGHFRTDGV